MTQTPDNGGPAFPVTIQTSDDSTETYFGMTLRDWFAGQAMMGMISYGDEHAPYGVNAYRIADAMIAARKAGDA